MLTWLLTWGFEMNVLVAYYMSVWYIFLWLSYLLKSPKNSSGHPLQVKCKQNKQGWDQIDKSVDLRLWNEMCYLLHTYVCLIDW